MPIPLNYLRPIEKDCPKRARLDVLEVAGWCVKIVYLLAMLSSLIVLSLFLLGIIVSK